MTKLLRIFILATLALPVVLAEDAFLEDIAKWKQRRHQSLLREDGWLALVGLHWLKEGQNAFGSDSSLPVVLEGEGIPARAGTFLLKDGRVWLRADPEVTLRGEPIKGELLVKTDADGALDVFQVGGLAFQVIRRKDRFGVRVKNPKHPALAAFKGIPTYRPNRAYRVVADFLPFAAPREIQVPTIIGYSETMASPGLVKFKLHGKVMTLEPVIEDPKEPELFFIFHDRSSGKGTYGAGRFLYAALPKDGKVLLDFNKAQNPPCAFTPFATCPLPPRQNWLPVAIKAGERAVGEH